MRKSVLAAYALALLIAAPLIAQDDQQQDMTLEKIIEMSKAGLSNETIINAIISSGVEFQLYVEDIIRLKEEGVSEDVINFLLRSQPEAIDTVEEQPQAEEEAPAEQEGELPEYVESEGNYYDDYSYTDDYVYTDGYYPEDERYSFIIYHYYGPWLRFHPFYFGFYYYPVSYYYYCWWPDDFYYYFYYPRIHSWHYYYYYPFHYRNFYWAGRNYYIGGRYIKTPSGRYIRRYSSDSTRYAVPRGSTSRTIRAPSTGGIRSSGITRGQTSPSTVRKRSTSPSIRYRAPSTSAGSRYRSPTSAASSKSRSSPSVRSRTPTSRSSGSSVRSRSYSSGSRASAVRSRSSGSSSRSSAARSSSSSRSRSSSSARSRPSGSSGKKR